MIKSDKKLKELSAVLSMGNKLAVREAILDLRDQEPFEGAIALLAALFDRSTDSSVRKTISDFMNDLKDNSVSGEVMKEIRKPFSHETIIMLISSCWQSGLDYSEYLDDLIDIFLASDFPVALECLTVIEESTGNAGNDRKRDLIRYIEDYPVQPENEKAGLTSELIYILGQSSE